MNPWGGVVGFNDRGAVANCHSTGTVQGGDCRGGVVGANDGSVANSYCPAGLGVEPIGVSGTVQGGCKTLSAEAYTNATSFSGWDFDDVWAMGPAGPELRAIGMPLWVGGTRVSHANAGDILGDGSAWFEGGLAGGTLVLSNAVVAGTHDFGGSGDGFENVLTIARTGDAVAHSVVISAEHATVEAPGAEAFEGRNFLFRIVPDPGWRVVGVVATDAAGTELELELWGDRYGFTMPDSAVTVTATVGPPLPWYLDDADDEVVENYDDWSARYAPDPAGTNLVAFLLDIDPATDIPAGAAPLKVTSFLVNGPIVRFELGSDIADLEVKTGAIRGSEPTCYVGNGVLVLSSGEDLSSMNEWRTVPLYVGPGENGRVVGEHVIAADIEIGGGGIGAIGGGGQIGGVIGFGSVPPEGFFRPTLSTHFPSDYGME